MAGNLTKLDCILMANDKASSSVLHVRNLTVGCISIVYSKRLANAGGGRQPFSDRLVPVVVIQIREYPPPHDSNFLIDTPLCGLSSQRSKSYQR